MKLPAMPRRHPLPALAVALLLAAAGPALGQAQVHLLAPGTSRPANAAPEAPSVASSWAEMEAAGVRIGAVRVLPQEVFDTSDPAENIALFRGANRVHRVTRARVIEKQLLFKPGDRVSVRVLEETERVLLANRFLSEVMILPLAYKDGVVDIDVVTRDAWSLDPGVNVSRSGGSTSGGILVRDYNFLGTGTTVGLGRTRNVDRSGNQFFVSNDHVFGSWTGLSFDHSSNTDGRRDGIALTHPFHSLDARWAAGARFSRDDRIDPIYNAGEVASEYRHQVISGEVFGGWSSGLQDGWVKRTSLGLTFQDDNYRFEPGRVAPPRLPADDRIVAPFVRYQLLEDRYQREVNRNLIGRPEFFALGLNLNAQLGLSTQALGADADALLYSVNLSHGWQLDEDRTVLAAGSVQGRLQDGEVRRQRVSLQTQYYERRSARRLFYAAASADWLTRPEVGDDLLLGGDNGLRGYPLRYQSGTRRALLTVEERFYTDIYVWRLFRIGGAAFVDVGRAWGGNNVNRADSGWLADAGLGLRIVSTRSAFGNVLHLDLAFPLGAGSNVKRAQVLLKSRATF